MPICPGIPYPPLLGSSLCLTPAWRGGASSFDLSAWMTLPVTCPQGLLTRVYKDKSLLCHGEKGQKHTDEPSPVKAMCMLIFGVLWASSKDERWKTELYPPW